MIIIIFQNYFVICFKRLSIISIFVVFSDFFFVFLVCIWVFGGYGEEGLVLFVCFCVVDGVDYDVVLCFGGQVCQGVLGGVFIFGDVNRNC